MRFRRSIVRRGFLPLLWIAVGVPALSAQESDLLGNSPFLPPGFNQGDQQADDEPVKPPVAPSNLQFRGVFEIAGVYRYNIFDRATGQGIWVSENDQKSGYEIQRFDADSSTLIVRIGGRPVTLVMERPDHKPIPVTAANSSGPTPPNAASSSSSETRNAPPPPPTRRRVVVPPRRTVTPTTAPPAPPLEPSPIGVPVRPGSSDTTEGQGGSHSPNSTSSGSNAPDGIYPGTGGRAPRLISPESAP